MMSPFLAIITRAIPASTTRGARIAAMTPRRRIVIPWDHALNADDNHIAAARALCEKREHDWLASGAKLISAETGKRRECVHIIVPHEAAL